MVRCMILIHPVSVASATAAPCSRARWTSVASIAPLSMAASTAPMRSAITGDIYGHTSDATTRAAIDGLTSALGL
jgi:hypothetical protein